MTGVISCRPGRAGARSRPGGYSPAATTIPVEGRVIVENGEIVAVEPRPAESTDIVRPSSAPTPASATSGRFICRGE
ncbi:hypothetical protein BRD02_02740 [Halobacteriales archaeon QS_8_69_73]|nr:MAG: hypothetical protein BRD02_02740 [Halobacteriales archaeon QS_8_69_73]